jgi:hypothetical protein
MTTGRLLLVGAVMAAGLVLPTTVRADVIDGNWCAQDGRTFAIDGSRIVTPAGTATTGDYTRHSFVYAVPPSEPGAGTRISMRLLNEDTVRLTVGTTTPEIWHRCDVTS